MRFHPKGLLVVAAFAVLVMLAVDVRLGIAAIVAGTNNLLFMGRKLPVSLADIEAENLACNNGLLALAPHPERSSQGRGIKSERLESACLPEEDRAFIGAIDADMHCPRATAAGGLTISNVNCTSLCASIGVSISSFMLTRDDGTASIISTRPEPTCRLPSHW